MLIEVKVPQLSESVAEATLLAWHKKQGEAVKRDENLIDIETDKVVLELPAPADGVLVSILKGDKSTVVAGEVIATIDTEGKASAVCRVHSAGRNRQRRKAKPAAALPPSCLSAQKIAAEKGIDTAPDPGHRPGWARDQGRCPCPAGEKLLRFRKPALQQPPAAGQCRQAARRPAGAARADVAPARSASPSAWCSRSPPRRSSPPSTK